MEKINNKAFDQLLKEYYSKIEKLSSEANIAYFNASISGSENDYNELERLQLEINKLYSDKNLFQQFKDFKDSGEITDDFKKRELQLIYNKFAGNQFDKNLHKEIVLAP